MSEATPVLLTYSVFAHLNVENTSLYRAILGFFVTERARFVISLRPTELQAALSALPESDFPPESIPPALQQLRIWGNLDDTADNADAATIEEFYQRRRLYQLSAAGEAAEQALAMFDEYLHRPGELQTAALQDIGELFIRPRPKASPSPLTHRSTVPGIRIFPTQCGSNAKRSTKRPWPIFC